MGWDPAVLRKYNTTGHFRLLNQVRSDLKGNPLNRPKDGETVGAANRSRSLIRALEVRPQSSSYGRRSRAAASAPVTGSPLPTSSPSPVQEIRLGEAVDSAGASTFRDRLSAIDMR